MDAVNRWVQIHMVFLFCCCGKMLWKKQLEGERVGFSPQSRGTAQSAWEVKVEELRGSWSSQAVRNQACQCPAPLLDAFKKLPHFLSLHCVFMCIHMYTSHCTHVGGRRQFVGVSSFFPSNVWAPGIWSSGLGVSTFTS